MPLRVTLIVIACLGLVVAQALGLHAHISHWDDDELAELKLDADQHLAHDEHIVPETEGAAGHLASHLDHGDVDLDEPAIFSGKTSILKVPVAVIGLVCALLLLVPTRTAQVFQPPRRPPKYRSKPHLLPPSQAPPLSA